MMALSYEGQLKTFTNNYELTIQNIRTFLSSLTKKIKNLFLPIKA